MNEEILNKVINSINKNKDIDTIAKELGLEIYQVYGLVQELINRGYLYEIHNGEVLKLQKPPKTDDIYQVPNNLEKLKLLLLSDTHLCSKYDRLDILRYLYSKASEKGVSCVLHSGDFTDGRSNRPEQVYELKEASYQGQVDYCVEKYPKADGIKTYVIQGNHDDWWYKSNGSEILVPISRQREDIIYLGPDVADLKIGKLKIRLYHGYGSPSYAKSYRIQKYLDSVPMNERPDILQTGHIHQAFYFKQDKTHCFQTGCLEDLTPYCRSLGLSGDKSVWWVDVDFDDKGNVYSVTPQLETFGAKKLIKK